MNSAKMSFENGFWMPSSSEHLSELHISENSCGVEPKRALHLLMDDSEKANKNQDATVNFLVGSRSGYKPLKEEPSNNLSGPDQPLKIFNVYNNLRRDNLSSSFHNDSLIHNMFPISLGKPIGLSDKFKGYSFLPSAQTFDKGQSYFTEIVQQKGNEGCKFPSPEGRGKFLALGGSCKEAEESFAIFPSSSCFIQMEHTFTGPDYSEGHGKFLSLGGENLASSSAIFPCAASNSCFLNIGISSDDVVTEESTRQNSTDHVMNIVPRETKTLLKPKVWRYNFPSNVKNLLSTGIFEGVPVKYVSWTREKSLKGIIKGTNYLCGCDRCKMKKKVNAYEFEHHAGCDTKHPNNHIYFPTGKSIYNVVQHLKAINQDFLFDAIKTVSGTPINIKNYQAWKALYEATKSSFWRVYGVENATC